MQLLRLVVAAVTLSFFFLGTAGPALAEPPTVLYRLDGTSGYLSGCIEGPCLCPVSLAYMGGTFGLTPDPALGPQAYSISNIDWFTHWNGEIQSVITGSGSYFLAGEEHRVVLDLQVDNGTSISIDSGFVVRGSEFPTIAISGLTDDFCFQEGVTLEAAPSAYSLDMAMSSVTDLTWTVVPDVAGYDVVHGNLMMLRENAGAYAYSDTSCLAGAVPATSAVHDAPLPPGEAVWFLVRGLPEPGYDSGGPGQVGSRDGEIAQSANACP